MIKLFVKNEITNTLLYMYKSVLYKFFLEKVYVLLMNIYVSLNQEILIA